MTTQLSQLGMEFGNQVHQVLRDTVLENLVPASLSEMEQGVRRAMLELGQYLLTSWLAMQNDRYPPETIPCRCGATAQYREMRPGVLLTIVGRLEYQRAYYLCDACHQGTYPLDERLGLRPGQLSAELENLAAMTGAQLTFRQGSDLFEQLTLVGLSPQSMDTATQALGAERQALEAEWVATSQDPTALLRQEREETPPQRLYGTLDATKVRTIERRDETDEGWRDLKVGAWFETEAQPPTHPDDDWTIQARDITYFCDIQAAETFGDLLWATGYQRQASLVQELVFLGDGASWIWNLVDHYYPQAVQIVDWFHAAEYLPPVAARVGSTAQERTAWLKQTRDDLWHGRVADVIAACAALVTTDAADDPAQKAVTYFTNNQHRMNYPEYRARGYHIGSGTVESGCKQISTQRLKVPGARWSLEGVRKVAKARAALLSSEWDTLVERRTHLARAA